jgi:uncharacterized membrane protein YccC
MFPQAVRSLVAALSLGYCAEGDNAPKGVDHDDRDPMTREAWARHVAFVLRCSGAATLSYVLANAIGLPHPVWAAMSGVIVGQEKLDETRTATIGRLFGTVVGVVVAVTIGSLLEPLHADVVVQMAVAVAVAAIIARRYPMLRVCMWTCPIVFLSTDAATPLAVVGFQRGAEVLLGGIVGALLHGLSETVISAMVTAAPEKPEAVKPKAASLPIHDD